MPSRRALVPSKLGRLKKNMPILLFALEFMWLFVYAQYTESTNKFIMELNIGEYASYAFFRFIKIDGNPTFCKTSQYCHWSAKSLQSLSMNSTKQMLRVQT